VVINVCRWWILLGLVDGIVDDIACWTRLVDVCES